MKGALGIYKIKATTYYKRFQFFYIIKLYTFYKIMNEYQ